MSVAMTHLLFHDLFVSSCCLYDESEHFALRRLYRSFHVLWWVPMFQMRSISSELSLRRTAGDDV